MNVSAIIDFSISSRGLLFTQSFSSNVWRDNWRQIRRNKIKKSKRKVLMRYKHSMDNTYTSDNIAIVVILHGLLYILIESYIMGGGGLG